MDKDNNTIESKPSTKEELSMSGGMDKSPGVGDGAMEEEEEEDVVLPGFRFHPTDEELVGFYLRRKVGKRPLSIELIKQIDIYKHDPWDLPKVSTAGENEWYFFCLRGRKYRNSIRPNRVTGSGFWKATGIDRPIYPSSGNGECIGLKKSLVYYRGSAGKGVKTDWMMHEFRLPSSNKNDSTNSSTIQEAEIWTICRIFKRNVTYKKYPQSWKESSTKQASTESNSKTSSFESDGSDGPNGYRFCYNTSAVQQGERPVTTYNFGEANQLYAGQWNAASQAPQTATYPQIQNPSATDVYREGNWDELGRIMEYMMDPAFAYECSS